MTKRPHPDESDWMRQKLEQISTQLREGFAAVDARFSRVETGVSRLETRVSGLEDQVLEVKTKMAETDYEPFRKTTLENYWRYCNDKTCLIEIDPLCTEAARPLKAGLPLPDLLVPVGDSFHDQHQSFWQGRTQLCSAKLFPSAASQWLIDGTLPRRVSDHTDTETLFKVHVIGPVKEALNQYGTATDDDNVRVHDHLAVEQRTQHQLNNVPALSHLQGRPDFAITTQLPDQERRYCVAVELKTPRELPGEDLRRYLEGTIEFGALARSRHTEVTGTKMRLFGAVQQLYGYMLSGGFRWGLLSTVATNILFYLDFTNPTKLEYHLLPEHRAGQDVTQFLVAHLFRILVESANVRSVSMNEITEAQGQVQTYSAPDRQSESQGSTESGNAIRDGEQPATATGSRSYVPSEPSSLDRSDD